MPAFRNRTVRRRPARGDLTLRPTFQPLEPRKLLSATASQIASALDLPEGVVVTFEGHRDAVGVFENYTVHGLLGLPSGPNGQFLVLSTAHAFDAVRTTDGATRDATTRYRDLGAEGAADDFATVRFTLEVPFAIVRQRLLIDFIYASDANTDGGDFFDIIVNGVNIAAQDGRGRIEAGGAYVTNERDPEIGGTVPGYGFQIGTEYTDLLTASYSIPDGVTTLEIEITIADSNDPLKDAWALIDNIRFETPQVVFLDFDGQDIGDFFLAGTNYVVPAFDANDFGLGGNFADVIKADLEAAFAPYAIQFVTSEPVSGEFMHVVIGGRNSDTVTISNTRSTEWLRRPLNASTTFRQLFNYVNFRNANGQERSFGMADRLDLDNGDRGDMAVVFAKEIARLGEFDYNDLINTISHYIGRNLGLRPEAATAIDSIMNEDILLRGSLIQDQNNDLLSVRWGDRRDGATVMRQNAHQVLMGNLGPSAEQSGIVRAFTDVSRLNEAHWTMTQPTRGRLFDAQFIIIGDKHTRTNATFADEWVETQILVTDYAGRDPQIVITASSRDNGRIDYETYGPRNLGQYNEVTNDARIVVISLFQEVGSLPVFRGQASVVQTDAADTTVYFRSFEYTEADGDLVTITLTSRTGLFAVEETEGGLVVTLAETDSQRDTMIINVRRRGGDGRAVISGILGSGLRTLKVLRTDIEGAGVDLTGITVGRFESILGGSHFNLRQDERVNGNIHFETIGADSRIVIGRLAWKFLAQEILGGTFAFGELMRFDARNNLFADRIDIEDGDRARIVVRGDAMGGFWAVWTETSKRESWRLIDVRGSVSDVTIHAPGRLTTLKVQEDFDADVDVLALNKAILRGDWTGHMILRHDGSDFKQSAVSINVTGAARGLLLQAQDSINSLQLGAAFDSNFYVGFDFSVTSGLVVDPTLIVNEDARVKTLKLRGVRGEAFDMVNSIFSAVTFGKVMLGNVNGDNGGVPFGLSARGVDRIEFNTGTGKIVNRGDSWFIDNDNSDDFLLGRII